MAETQPQFAVGDRCFSHYTKNSAAGISGWGTVVALDHTVRGSVHGVTGNPLPDTTWYEVRPDEGGRELLDDAHGVWDMARIVPPRIAERYGYGTDPRSNHPSQPVTPASRDRYLRERAQRVAADLNTTVERLMDGDD